MAQSILGTEKRHRVDEEDVVLLEDQPRSKRLKQGRLPFKPLDCKSQVPLAVKCVSKKRKHSDQDSPILAAKQPKLQDLRPSAEKSKSVKLNNDNEVSSSSEAEHLSANNNSTRIIKNNILEKFVRREDEITSTNDVIDLTEGAENEDGENCSAKTFCPQKRTPDSVSELKVKKGDHFARKLVFHRDITRDVDLADTLKEKILSFSSSVEDNQDACINANISESKAEGSSPCMKNQENKSAVMNADCMDSDTPDNSVLESSGIVDTSTPKKKPEEEPSTETSVTEETSPTVSDSLTHESCNNTSSSINGTPPANGNKRKTQSKKHLERTALRQKVKEEKERQKKEAKEQKEKERLEKEQKRKEEKAEKDRAKMEEKEKREKEKQNKKNQVEKLKQEKLQQKEEDRRKKIEQLSAKSEEKKKREEEKRLKEEQKQKEDEAKIRQAEKNKAAFTSFFVKPKAVTSTKVDKADSFFIPFEIKKDMTLAPVRRRNLSPYSKQYLDDVVQAQVSETGSTNLEQLKQRGNKQPVRTNRVLRKKKEVEEEVELLVHDSEVVKKVTYAVKLLQFHTDYRPPYYGTWRKKAPGISPRNPWKKNEDVLDYEVDSDAEWEEEEPGESLSDSNGEEEEGEEEDEAGDDDGWMVPHGYLSEDEGCDDDEEVTPEVLKARQTAKAQAWEAELRAKKRVQPPMQLGCFWQNNLSEFSEHLELLKQFEMVCLRTAPVETLISCPEMVENLGDKHADKFASKPAIASKRCRKRSLPDKAMPDLIRLVHANSFGIKKLVREFRLYWKQKLNSLDTSLNISHIDLGTEELNLSNMETSTTIEEPVAGDAVSNAEQKSDPAHVGTEEKRENGIENKIPDDNIIDEKASDSFVSKRQLEMKIMAIAMREKREENKKQCWYVNQDILKQYDMADLPMKNSWVYVSGDIAQISPSPCAGKIPIPESAEKKTASCTAKMEKPVIENTGKYTSNKEFTPKEKKCKKDKEIKNAPKDQPSIMAFAKNTPAKEILIKTKQRENYANKTRHIKEKPTELDRSCTHNNKLNEYKGPLQMEDDCIVLD